MKQFLRKYLDLIVIIFSWIAISIAASPTIAAGVSIISVLYIINKQDYSKILLAFIAVLILSDTRTASIEFAGTVKLIFPVALALMIVLKWNEFRSYTNPLLLSFAPFFVYLIISLPLAADMVNSAQKVLSYILLFATVPMLLAAALKQNPAFKTDFIAFVGFMLLIGFLFFVISPAYVTLVGRYRGVMGNPNGLGIFLSLVFPSLIYLTGYLDTGRDSRRLKILVFIVFVASLLLTQSRTAMFSVLLFFVFSRFKALRSSLGLVVFISILVSYQYILLKLPEIIQFLGWQEFFRLETLEDGSGRLIAWNFAWEQIQKNFFFGLGFDYTNYLYYSNYRYLSMLGHQGNAHNSYLTLWLDSGLIGLALFVLGIVWMCIRSLRANTYTLPAIYAFAFSANFESWLAASLNPFTILFVIFFSWPVAVAAENEERTQPADEIAVNST